MGVGRPPDGPKHASHLDGDDESKRRLRVVLETLSGERSVESACQELGVSASRFHELRREALQAALDGLAPGASGRPKRKEPEVDPKRLEALERENDELKFELQAARVRTELALTMPHLLTRKGRAEIKKKSAGGATPLAQGIRRAWERHMRRVQAVVESWRERKAERRRRGPRRQRRRRQAERLVRISVLAFTRWAGRRGLSMAQAAVRLGLDPSTLGVWRARWSRDRLQSTPRGRPVEPLKRDDRWSLLAVFGLMGMQVGLPTLQSLFPEIARSALLDYQRRCRDIFFRKAAWVVHTLRWTRAGAVWAMDFAVPPAPIEGLYTRLLVVRDLASGYVLVAIPTLAESATLVIRVLESLFRWFGAPLVLKSDNGAPFTAEEVKDFLREHGVHALYSPEGTPAYNGSVEAGIGSIKVRAFWHAALDDRPGEWTCDDIEAAMRQANETGRPHGVGAPTPQESWLWRRPISASERRTFAETVSRFGREEYTQRGWLPMAQLQHREQASIGRVAISRALIELGFLLIRRRRITPPISILRQRKIS